MYSYAQLKKESWPSAMALPDHDAELIGRIASGDETALQELYGLYGQRMFAYALRLTGDPAPAEDAVQTALVAVWQGAGRYRGEGRVLAWLLGIVHHAALKSIRRPGLPITEAMEESLPEEQARPEEQALAAERSRLLREGMRALSPEHRAALELVFYQDMSIAEAAGVCGCPPGTIKSRLSYARRYLRGCLERRKGEDWK